jgi:adenylosuccinate synthase
MSTVVLVGAQWGDEGKGKITDFLAEKADYVVRYQGGSNAGHTVVVGDEKFQLHLVPSGILYPDKVSVIGNGVALDPVILLQEIDNLSQKGIDVKNLKINILEIYSHPFPQYVSSNHYGGQAITDGFIARLEQAF